MSAHRRSPRRKIPSKRRLIAQFFRGKPIARQWLEERPEALVRMKPRTILPDADYIVMKSQ